MKKSIKRFIRESKQNSLLGQKRRLQRNIMLFGLFIFAFVMAAVWSSDMSTTQKVMAMAVAPVAATDLTRKAKNIEELNEDEKVLLGTIQKEMQSTVKLMLKGVEPETIEKKLNAIEEKLKNGDIPESKNIKEALEIVTKANDKIIELSNEIADLKNKGQYQFETSEIEKSFKKAMESDKYKSLLNETSKSTGQFEISLKNRDMLKKTVSTSDHTGTVYGNMKSDIAVSDPFPNKVALRDYMNVIDGSEEDLTSFTHLVYYDFDRAAIAVSENGSLPEGSFKTKEVTSECSRIGWYKEISKRQLRKINVILDMIMSLLPRGINDAENFQFVFGDNSTPNFKGITEVCQTHANLTAEIYSNADIGTAGFTVDGYDNDAKTLVTFTNPLPKMKTGMKITFSGATGTDANDFNGTHEIIVVNDKNIVINLAKPTVTLTNAKAKIENMWGQFIPNANKGDALRTIASYLNFWTVAPNLILMHPITYASIQGMKNVHGDSISGDYIQTINGMPYLDGIYPIGLVNFLPKGKVLAGDFFNGCLLIDAQVGYLEFVEDSTTKIGNYVVALIQEEVIFSVTIPDAFMYADLDSVVSTINVATPRTVNVAITSPLNATKDAIMTDTFLAENGDAS